MQNEITLRPWTIADLDNLVKYANNWKIAKNMTDKFPFPYTESDGKSFIKFAIRDNPIHIFAIAINKQAVGGIGIHLQNDIHKKNAELGYWLAEPFWSQGVVSKAIKHVLKFAFETFDVDRIFARPFGTNIGSQKVLEKNGFVLEGKFEKVLTKDNELIDELIYAIRRENKIYGPTNLNFDLESYPWKRSINYREHPEAYRVGKGDQGVLMCEPYKSEVGQYWRFKTSEIAVVSSEKIYEMFEDYIRLNDFVGADMARKYLQMGYTRARRYANYKGGKKYDKEADYKPLDSGTGKEA